MAAIRSLKSSFFFFFFLSALEVPPSAILRASAASARTRSISTLGLSHSPFPHHPLQRVLQVKRHQEKQTLKVTCGCLDVACAISLCGANLRLTLRTSDHDLSLLYITRQFAILVADASRAISRTFTVLEIFSLPGMSKNAVLVMGWSRLTRASTLLMSLCHLIIW